MLADIDYRFVRSALDGKLGLDAWLALWGLRTDLIIRQEIRDGQTRFGAAIGAQMIIPDAGILYTGANLVSGTSVEGVVGFTWLFDGL